MNESDELPTILFASDMEWESWLEINCTQISGIWLKFAKKNSGKNSITYDQALNVALCYGWIDAQVKIFDDNYYRQKFTPRRPKSVWSKRNVGKIEQLIKDGKMKSSGLKSVELAKLDGRWEQAYESQANMKIQPEFQVALDQNPEANAFFQTLNKANSYSFLWRIQTATTPEIRDKLIIRFIVMLKSHETFH